MVVARKLPRAEVAGEHEYPVAAVARGKIVVQAFVADEARGGLAGVAGHLCELGKLPAEVAVFKSKDALAFSGRFVREGEREIAQANLAEARDRKPGDAGDHRSRGTGEETWERAGSMDEEPGRCELKDVTRGGPGRQLGG